MSGAGRTVLHSLPIPDFPLAQIVSMRLWERQPPASALLGAQLMPRNLALLFVFSGDCLLELFAGKIFFFCVIRCRNMATLNASPPILLRTEKNVQKSFLSLF